MLDIAKGEAPDTGSRTPASLLRTKQVGVFPDVGRLVTWLVAAAAGGAILGFVPGEARGEPRVQAKLRGVIAFQVRVAGRDSDLGLMDLDQRRFRWLTKGTRFDDVQPSWSPDGRRLVFRRASTATGVPTLYTLSLATGRVRRLLRLPALDHEPAWSPDGRWIAFMRRWFRPREDTQLFLARPDGRGLRRLTSLRGGVQDPTWSPDSRRLAFVALDQLPGDLHPQRDIFALSLRGGAHRQPHSLAARRLLPRLVAGRPHRFYARRQPWRCRHLGDGRQRDRRPPAGDASRRTCLVSRRYEDRLHAADRGPAGQPGAVRHER